MRVLKVRIVVLLITACAASGCGAGAGTSPVAGLDGPPRLERHPAYATVDSAAAEELRQIFEEAHAFLVGELEALAKPGRIDARLDEIRSIVETAEEFYLEGRTLIAIELLAEAEVLLKTNP